jgi:hypothetical protein
MSVNLADLIPSVKREVAPPGSEETLFPGANNSVWLGHLMDGFWEARYNGLLPLWESNGSGIVTPFDPQSGDLPRELQQVVVFFAGFRILRNALMQKQTSFHARAGDVEYQTQYSASTLRDVLKSLTEQRAILLTRLSDLGFVSPVYIDAIIARQDSIVNGLTYWVGA